MYKRQAWISGTYNTEYNISTHDAANKYYVRVRAWKYFQEGSVYSDFCEPAQIEGLVAPGEFAVTGRGNGGKALWLDWADVGGATEYDVYDVTNGASELKGTSETSDFTFTDLNPAWEYDIKVVAKNAFENVERSAGETKWSFWKLFLYSIEGILAYSTAPLAVASVFGIAFCGVSFISMLVIVIRALVFGDPVAGWPSLVTIIFFLGGIQLLCLGIMGLYLSKTYLETKKRPIYIVRESE